MEEERRRDVRARVSLPTSVLRRSGVETVQMVDASYRGLFVRMVEPPSIRELLKLQISMPKGEMFVHGVVVRLVEEGEKRWGAGLRFFALNGQERIEWESFIAHIVNQRAPRAA